MPFIALEFSIPKNTPANIPVRQINDLGVNSQRIQSVEIIIPDGHKGLPGMRIEIPGRVIIPDTGSSVQWVRGNNTTIKSIVNAIVDGPPYQVTMYGFNLDAFLSHTFIINITTGEN